MIACVFDKSGVNYDASLVEFNDFDKFLKKFDKCTITINKDAEDTFSVIRNTIGVEPDVKIVIEKKQ